MKEKVLRAICGTILPVSAAFLVFFLQGFGAARYDAPTYDEPIHLTCGYVYLKTGAYWLETSAPPLARVIAAIPLLFMPLTFSVQDLTWAERGPLAFAASFLSYNRVPLDTIFLAARSMMLLMGFILAAVLWTWAKKAWGQAAAAAALLFFATCPPLIAYGHLVTTDFVFTAAFTATLWGFWEFLRAPVRRETAFLTGAALGAAMNIKYSAFCLFAIMPCLFFLERPWTKHSWKTLVQGLVMMAATALFLCLPFYGLNWKMFWQGIVMMRDYSSHGWPGYLLGHYSNGNWRWYFIALLLFKTPLVLLFSSLGSLWIVKTTPARRFLYIWVFVPAVLYLALASTSHIQVGVRHILPLYPLLCLAAGAAASGFWQRGGLRRFIGAAAMMISVLVSLFAYPHYIAYFGELAGGSKNGYRVLTDSNCDWGQELKALASYLHEQNTGPIYLSYFGEIDPAVYGVRYEALSPETAAPLRRDRLLDMPPTRKVLLAVSATNFQGVYHRHHDDFKWLETRRPVRVFGYSLFLYDITHDAGAHREMARLYRDAGWRRHADQELKWVKWIESGEPL